MKIIQCHCEECGREIYDEKFAIQYEQYYFCDEICKRDFYDEFTK